MPDRAGVNSCLYAKDDRVRHRSLHPGNLCQSQPHFKVNGILKAEAVFRFAEVLHKYEIHYFQDVPKAIANPGFERAIRLIPGQRSGISHDYFLMLTGSEDFIKPDRMVLRFLSQVLRQPVTIPQA